MLCYPELLCNVDTSPEAPALVHQQHAGQVPGLEVAHFMAVLIVTSIPLTLNYYPVGGFTSRND